MLEHWLYGHSWEWWTPRIFGRSWLWKRCTYCGKKKRVEVMELRLPKS